MKENNFHTLNFHLRIPSWWPRLMKTRGHNQSGILVQRKRMASECNHELNSSHNNYFAKASS